MVGSRGCRYFAASMVGNVDCGPSYLVRLILIVLGLGLSCRGPSSLLKTCVDLLCFPFSVELIGLDIRHDRVEEGEGNKEDLKNASHGFYPGGHELYASSCISKERRSPP